MVNGTQPLKRTLGPPCLWQDREEGRVVVVVVVVVVMVGME